MSVTTRADELLRQASENLKSAALLVQQAHKDISEAITPDTWGRNDLGSSRLEQLENAELKTLLMYRELTKMQEAI